MAAMRRPALAAGLLFAALYGTAWGERRRPVARLQPEAAEARPSRAASRRLLSSAAVFFAALGGGGGVAAGDEAEEGRGEKKRGWFFKAKVEEESDETMLNMFKSLVTRADLDGDGALNPLELEFFGHLTLDMMMAVPLQGIDLDPAMLGLGRSMLEGEEAMAMFRELDKNGDEKLDRTEVKDAVRSFTGAQPGESLGARIEEWVDIVFGRADVTGDGLLNPGEAEFFRYLAREVTLASAFAQPGASYLNQAARTEVLSQVFKEFDKDNDGKIDLTDAAMFFAGADKDGDGQISLSELLDLAKS